MRVHSCPCCGNALLRHHARRKGVYWFCTYCHQEMMPLSESQLSTRLETKIPRSHTLHSVNT